MGRLKHWIWLSCVDGVRPRTKYDLVQTMGGVDAVFFADRDKLIAQPGVTEAEAKHLTEKIWRRRSRSWLSVRQ
jgi:hypothetical protein